MLCSCGYRVRVLLPLNGLMNAASTLLSHRPSDVVLLECKRNEKGGDVVESILFLFSTIVLLSQRRYVTSVLRFATVTHISCLFLNVTVPAAKVSARVLGSHPSLLLRLLGN